MAWTVQDLLQIAWLQWSSLIISDCTATTNLSTYSTLRIDGIIALLLHIVPVESVDASHRNQILIEANVIFLTIDAAEKDQFIVLICRANDFICLVIEPWCCDTRCNRCCRSSSCWRQGCWWLGCWWLSHDWNTVDQRWIIAPSIDFVEPLFAAAEIVGFNFMISKYKFQLKLLTRPPFRIHFHSSNRFHIALDCPHMSHRLHRCTPRLLQRPKRAPINTERSTISSLFPYFTQFVSSFAHHDDFN